MALQTLLVLVLAALLQFLPSVTADTLLTVYPGDGSFKYLGCYNETTTLPGSSGARALPGSMQSVETLTALSCISFCGAYTYAGMEYGRECWCAQYLNSLSAKLADGDCNIPCAGNSSMACGGSSKLTVYSKGTATSGSSTKSGSSSSSKSSAGRTSVIGTAQVFGGVGLAALLLL